MRIPMQAPQDFLLQSSSDQTSGTGAKLGKTEAPEEMMLLTLRRILYIKKGL